MILLLAQAATDTAPMPLPTVWHGIAIGTFGSIIILLFVVAFMLRRFRSFRSDIAQELKRELAGDDKAKRIDIQQPLEVREHVEYATTAQLDVIKGDIEIFRHETNTALNDLRLERSRSTGNLHERIEKIDERNKQRIDELRREIGDRIDALPARILTIINESRKI